MSKSALFTLSTITVIAAALASACMFEIAGQGQPDGNAGDDDSAVTGEAADRGGAPTPADLAGRRARVLWEAARAMVGPNAASSYTWPLPAAGTTYTLATYPYIASDAGAWSAMLKSKAYDRNGVANYNVSCTIGGYSCSLKVPVAKGLLAYTCQGECVSGVPMHGGQCKSFSNLILYRSGVYHGDSWAFKGLPIDSVIRGNLPKYPFAKKGQLQAGDVLRIPDGHSIFIIRVLNSESALVFDSNWIRNGTNEIVGTHVMKFGDSGYCKDLGTYQSLNCVYDGSC